MDCPALNELKAYVANQTTDELSRSVETHLSDCARCQSVCEGLLDAAGGFGDRLAAALREPVGEAPLPALWQEQLCAQPPLAETATGAGRSRPVVFPEEPTARGRLGKVGPYHIAKLLGQGGFGAVYQAWDETLQRWVALKVLLPQVSSFGAAARGWDERRRRFAEEARLASQVKDEHVVDIRHVGEFASPACDLGPLPYLEMEHLAGGSLDRHLAVVRDWSHRQIADLTRQIALGLAAAHARHVLHRDVKPSNVLFEAAAGPEQQTAAASVADAAEQASEPRDPTPPDPSSRVKLADFGLAVAMTASPDERLTAEGQTPGTVAYMSPEQARGVRRLDPRSDVYSLGVVLYELLAGELPFRGRGPEILEQKKSREPAPLRLQNAKIPSDLETITLKCLRLEPDRRYADGAEVAEELRRFLDHEPIRARSVGWIQRLALRARRNPSLAVALVLLLAAITAGLAGVASQWRRANREWARAEGERDRAEGHLQETLAAFQELKKTYDEVARLAPDSGTRDQAVRANERAVQLAKQLAAGYPDRFDLQLDLGKAYNDLGEMLDYIGQREQARHWHRRAIEFWQSLRERAPDPTQIDYYLAISYMNLATLAASFDESEDLLLQAETLLDQRDRQRQLDDDGRRLLAGVCRNLGNDYLDLRRLDEALARFGRAIEILKALAAADASDWQTTVQLAETYNSQALTLGRFGGEHSVEAEAAFDAASAALEAVVQSQPGIRQPLDSLAMVLNNRGLLRQRQGNLDAAGRDFAAACERRARLVALDPTNVKTTSAWANNHMQLASVLADQGDYEQASSHFAKAVEILGPLAERHPDQPQHRDRLAQAHSGWAIAEVQAGRSEAAQQQLAISIAHWTALAEQLPDDPSFRVMLAKDLGNRALIFRQQERPAEALASLEQSHGLLQQLAEEHPIDLRIQNDLATGLELRGNLQADAQQPQAAVASYQASLHIRRTLAEQSPQEPALRRNVASSLLNLGEMLLDGQPDVPAAGRNYEEAEGILDDLVAGHQDSVQYRLDLGNCRNGLARVRMAAGQWNDALAYEEQAGRDLQAAADLAPGDARCRELLDMHCSDLAKIRRQLGCPAEAAQE